MAREHYDAMEQIVTNICKAFGNVDVRDVDKAITNIPKPQDLVD